MSVASGQMAYDTRVLPVTGQALLRTLAVPIYYIITMYFRKEGRRYSCLNTRSPMVYSCGLGQDQ